MFGIGDPFGVEMFRRSPETKKKKKKSKRESLLSLLPGKYWKYRKLKKKHKKLKKGMAEAVASIKRINDNGMKNRVTENANKETIDAAVRDARESSDRIYRIKLEKTEADHKEYTERLIEEIKLANQEVKDYRGVLTAIGVLSSTHGDPDNPGTPISKEILKKVNEALGTNFKKGT